MANTGDGYVISLNEAQLDWGEFRNTASRPPIPDECYIPIPKAQAVAFQVYNTLYGRRDVLGENLFNYRTADGFMKGQLRAQGNVQAGEEYAKQFADSRGLKFLKPWFDYIGATPGTQIEVRWESPTDIVLTDL